MMSGDSKKIVDPLKETVYGNQLGMELAKELESAILQEFPDADDDERFEELLHTIALYEPGGGDYLYGNIELIEEARRVLFLLQS